MNCLSPKSANTFRRRGSVAALTAISMVPLLLFTTLAVDVGYICALTAEQQNTADAAALAGASALRESLYDQYDDRALNLIARNQEAQGYLSLTDQVVEVGRWDKTTLTFTALAPADASSANAVRVVAARNQVPLFVAGLMGINTTNVTREAVAQVTPSCNGIWGVTSVIVPGNVMIDSYDSTLGAYSVASANANGDVCSNGEITVSGSADIYGDVLADIITLNGGALTISGFTEDSIDPVDVPPADMGDSATNNDNATIGLTDGGVDVLDVNEHVHLDFPDNLTLAPGTYYFKHLKLVSSATLTLTGPTTIYLAGNLDMDGTSTLNTTQNTSDLTIISTGTLIQISGNAQFYGSIYAPAATIVLSGNAEYFGAMIGNIVNISGNFDFHVDNSLPLMGMLKGPVLLVR